MKYIVNFSGGACSFWAAFRTIQRYGIANVILLFADTLYEDEDLYVFNAKAEKILGLKIIRVSLEMTPWQLFRKEGLIGNDRFPICSTKLKRELCNEWMQSHYEMDRNQDNALFEKGTVVFGFDHTEWNRVTEFEAQHPTWSVLAPMCDIPLWDKCRMLEECSKLGFDTPKLYRLGFPHNNCGGGCVKAGISHWVHLYHTLPNRFAMWEREELETQQVFLDRGMTNAHFTMLKDRRGGETKPLSLFSLRARIEAGEEFSKHEWGGCGCGGATQDARSSQST